MLLNRGISPEKIPPAEDIKKVERRLEAEQKKLAGQVKRLEIDETGQDGALQ